MEEKKTYTRTEILAILEKCKTKRLDQIKISYGDRNDLLSSCMKSGEIYGNTMLYYSIRMEL